MVRCFWTEGGLSVIAVFDFLAVFVTPGFSEDDRCLLVVAFPTTNLAITSSLWLRVVVMLAYRCSSFPSHKVDKAFDECDESMPIYL